MKQVQAAFIALFVIFSAPSAWAADATNDNRYAQQVFVANKAKYKPSIATEPKLIDAWGLSIRPAGAGGHFLGNGEGCELRVCR